jgi:hypothetical protein
MPETGASCPQARQPDPRQVGGPSWPPVNELTRDWLGMQDLEERKRNIT